MDRIQFDARVEEEGILRIPEQYSHDLAKGKNVRVTISDKPKERATVKFLRENPLHAPGCKPLKRDELYDRS